MDFGIILMLTGITIIFLSFFAKDPAKKVVQDVEDLSMSIYQETNKLNKRIKAVEEELMLEASLQFKPLPKKPTTATTNETYTEASAAKKSINPIIMNQVLALHKQGLNTADISVRSNLTEAEVVSVIAQNGGI